MHHYHNADGRWRDLDGWRDCARRKEDSCARTAQGQSPTTQIKGGFIMTKSTIKHQKVLSEAEWLKARKKLLALEKEFTHQRDALSAERRNLPWVKVDKPYVFDGPKGKETLADLFDGRSQLVVDHFVFDGAKEKDTPGDLFDGRSKKIEYHFMLGPSKRSASVS